MRRFSGLTQLAALALYTGAQFAYAASTSTGAVYPPPVTEQELQDPVTPEQEHRLRVDAASTLEPLPQGLVGESINGYTGSVAFSVTDVSIPGNSELAVAVARRVDINDLRFRGQRQRNQHIFEDWDLDVPHLHGVFAATTGWQAGPVG